MTCERRKVVGIEIVSLAFDKCFFVWNDIVWIILNTTDDNVGEKARIPNDETSLYELSPSTRKYPVRGNNTENIL